MKVFWKRFKWVVIAVGVAIALLLLMLLAGFFQKEDSDGSKTDPLPDVGEKLKEAVRQAEEEALVARVEARVEAETQKEELAEIAAVEDGAERRRRLAEMLRRL